MKELMKFDGGIKVQLTDTIKSEYWREQIGKRYAVWINQKVVFKTDDKEKAAEVIYGITDLFSQFMGEVTDFLSTYGVEKKSLDSLLTAMKII